MYLTNDKTIFRSKYLFNRIVTISSFMKIRKLSKRYTGTLLWSIAFLKCCKFMFDFQVAAVTHFIRIYSPIRKLHESLVY